MRKREAMNPENPLVARLEVLGQDFPKGAELGDGIAVGGDCINIPGHTVDRSDMRCKVFSIGVALKLTGNASSDLIYEGGASAGD